MGKQKKQKSEEELERRRIVRRERYNKIKNDPELYAAEQEKKRLNYLKRKHDKKVKSINEMGPREQRIQRRKWKESAKKYYKKKVSQRIIENVTVSEVSKDDENISPNVDPLNIVRREVKSRSETEIKLIKKLRTVKMQHQREKQNLISLLNRYSNRIKVLQRKIFKSTNQTHMEPENTTEDRKRSLLERLKKNARNINIQQMIQKFYEDDINSRITSGKKQYKKKHGTVKQIRYLLDSMKNLHKKFLDENPNIKISYTTFTRLRPFWVSLPVDDRDTCACTLHTNLNLLIAALNKENILHEKNSQDLVTKICCDKYNLDCLSRKCLICKEKKIRYEEFKNDQEIRYMQWERDTKKVGNKDIKIIKKNLKKSDPRNLIIKLENIIPNFLSHTNNIVNQYITIKSLKESMTSDESLIHMDFSENYSYKYAEEVQSMHFGGSRGQVCLHTAVIYLKNKLLEPKAFSICTASECTRHDAAAVWAHLNYLIKFTVNQAPNINRIHILTDGPCSQYRNKYIFYIVTQIKNDFPQLNLITWNYQEAGHGKDAPDGIGAVIKRTADYHVKCQKDVGSFAAFIDIIKNNVKNIELGIIEEHEIKMKELMLPKEIATFKGTMTVHQVVWSSNSTYLEFRKQSCFECLNIACVHNKHMRYFQICNVPVEPETVVDNINVIPESKRIRVLSDITFSYGNVANNDIAETAPSRNDGDVRITSLRSIRRCWANRTFVNDHTKATGHEKEFLKFIGKSKDENDFSD